MIVNALKRKKIGEILVDRGDLNLSDLSFALAIIKHTGERLGKVCLINSLISEEALAQALAEQFGMEYVNLKDFKMDEAILSIFPHILPPEAINRYHFVPLEPHGDSLVIAVADPTDVLKLDELEFFLHRPLIFKLATESAIESILQTGDGISWVLKEVSDEQTKGLSCKVKIPVISFAKSVFFYRDFLGLSIKKQSQDEVVFDQGLVLVPSTYTANLPEGFHIRSLVQIQLFDIEERFFSAEKQNIRIVSKLALWGRSGRLFFRCLDPDGNVVEVFSNNSL
jgi:catechol 2,3-dioxygenase-like lactoylglutathione lyase family enzyme